MAIGDKVKGDEPEGTLQTIRNLQPLASGAYPSEIIEGGDTHPMHVDPGAFDEAEDTRAENQAFAPDITESHHDAAPSDSNDGWGGWDPDNWDEYWMRAHAIEAASNESDEAFQVALKEYGLRDKAHFDEVRDAFQGRYGEDPTFMQAALDSRTCATKNAMNARMQGELKGELAPFDGVALEQWAWVMAKIASGGNPAELLVTAKMDQGKWDRVSAEWNARMSRDTTATIATAYGQAFVATGPGPFGDVGQATASAMLDPNARDVGGAPPIPMESWIEITEAQNAASQRGEDAQALLASYGLTPADWGVVGGWWSQHVNANAMKLLGEYNRLSEHYKRKFSR